MLAPPYSIDQLDLTPPTENADLANYLARNFALLQLKLSSPQIVLSAYDAQPARAAVTNLFGGLIEITTTPNLRVGLPIVVNNGLGKLGFACTGVVDGTGDILLQGTKVDRVTGVRTPGFIETISLENFVASVDSSTTDANGNPVFDFSGGFMSANWFVGTVVISTALPNDVDFTNVRVFGIAFEQLNDSQYNEVETLDINLLVTNTAARFDAYMYMIWVDPLTDLAGVRPIAEVHLGTPNYANRYYRLRHAELHEALDGRTDGVFVQAHYSSSPSRIEDTSIKVWLNTPRG